MRKQTDRCRQSIAGTRAWAGVLVATVALLAAFASSASATGPTTSCNLSSNNNPSNAGESVTFRFFANTDIPPGPPGPSGVVGFFDGLDPIPFATAILTPDGLTLDHSTVTTSTSSLSPGDHTISANIIVPNAAFGNTPCPGLPPSITQKVQSAVSTTAVASSVNPTKFGQSTTFTATVTRAAGGTPTGSVQFKADGNDLGSAQTLDGAGHASITTSALAAGNHPITAFFTSSNANTLNSDGSLASGQTVDPAGTTTGVTSSRNPSELGQAVIFTATTGAVAPGAGTPTGSVQFRDNGTDLGAPQTVDGSGQTSISTSALTVGDHTISATYTPANGNFTGSSGSVAQTVDRATTVLAYTGATTGDFHDPATLSAKLTRQDDASPVTSKPVHLSMASESCDATTNASGVASCSITPQEASGGYTAAGSFAGDAGYKPSSDSKPFTVTREQTTLTYTGDTVILNGGAAHASALLKEDDGAPAIAGRSVTFTLGSAQTCTALTDAAGRAACDIGPVSQPLGPGTVKAVFNQDAFYLASSNAATTIVYAFPSKGAFAIGDRNAANNSSVTYFGDQWAKVNGLTGGAAPDAFKGFVTAPGSPPRCGVAFTADPGNSGKPPDTVPSYMGTLVTRTVAKSGSLIRGDVVRIVVVKTGAYGPSPGRGGAGLVVTAVC